jgi:hypothetical protein
MLSWGAESVAHAVGTTVIGRLGRLPLGEQIVGQLEHLDPDGVAAWLRVRVGSPKRNRQIAAGACRCCHQKVDFGEQLEVVTDPSWRGFYEVALVVASEAGDLEDVYHVVYVKLRQAEGSDRTHEVRVTVEVVRCA